MARPSKYPEDLRERAVRMVAEVRPDYPSQWAAISVVASKLGIGTPETLRTWIRRREVDAGPGLRWGVEPMCTVLTEHGIKISPATYDEWVNAKPTRRQLRDAEVLGLLEAERRHPRPGSWRPPWAHAGCGSGCAARATTSPGAPWNG